jgi:hypothetical protein
MVIDYPRRDNINPLTLGIVDVGAILLHTKPIERDPLSVELWKEIVKTVEDVFYEKFPERKLEIKTILDDILGE